jgi:hypothetical protein
VPLLCKSQITDNTTITRTNPTKIQTVNEPTRSCSVVRLGVGVGGSSAITTVMVGEGVGEGAVMGVEVADGVKEAVGEGVGEGAVVGVEVADGVGEAVDEGVAAGLTVLVAVLDGTDVAVRTSVFVGWTDGVGVMLDSIVGVGDGCMDVVPIRMVMGSPAIGPSMPLADTS